MSMVLVATTAQIFKSGFLDPSAVFLPSVAVIFIVTGFLHPNEIFNLLHGFLYLVTIPGGYLLLVTYALCNLHIVSWGTREVDEIVTKKKNNKTGVNESNTTGRENLFSDLPILSFDIRFTETSKNRCS